MIIPFTSQLGGLNTSLSPFLSPANSATMLNGVNPAYKLGALLKDTGYNIVGSALQANKPIGGLFNFKQTGAQKMLATVDDATSDDTQLFYSTGGAWTEVTSAETAWANKAGITVEMEAFLNYCFFVGYGSTDGFLPVASLTGTTFSTTVNVTDMPQAKYIKRYRDQLYLANCYHSSVHYPFRVYFSSIPTAGAITWTPSTDFFDVDYGEELTGEAQNWDRLVLFTQNSAYLYDGSQLKKAWDVGCANHRTIRTQSAYMIWCDYDGVWVSTGGQPENIASPVIDFIRNGTPSNFFACMVDEEYRLYVGSVTVNGVSYAGCELIFNIPTSQWYTRELGHTMSVFAPYNDSGRIRQFMGSSLGVVYNKGKYTDNTILTSDYGLPIAANFELAPLHLEALNIRKGIREIIAFAEKAQGLKLKYRVIDRNTRALTPYQSLGELTQYVSKFKTSSVPAGVLLQIAGSENSQLPYFSFYGYALDVIKSSEI